MYEELAINNAALTFVYNSYFLSYSYVICCGCATCRFVLCILQFSEVYCCVVLKNNKTKILCTIGTIFLHTMKGETLSVSSK